MNQIPFNSKSSSTHIHPSAGPSWRNQPRASRPGWRLAAVVAVSSLALSAAAQKTWTGGGTDANWGTAANWTAGVPVAGDLVVFSGATRTTNYNNIANLSLGGIRFDATSFLLGGLYVTNTGGVVDTVGNNTNAFIMVLGAPQSFTNVAPGTTLQFSANITNNGNALTIGGDGNVFLNGIVGGTNAPSLLPGGSLTMAGTGTLRLAGANSFAGGLTINNGTVLIANGGAVPSGAGRGDLTVNALTTLNLNGNNLTANGLYGGGTIDNGAGTGTYTLTVGNNSTNSAGIFSGTIGNGSGAIALTKVNTNTFTLTGNAGHSGPTTINAGTVVLGPTASLSVTPRINLLPGAVLDVSANPFLVGFGQTLTAGRATNGGPNDVVGSINVGQSGSLAIYRGGAAGTLTIGGGLALSGGTISYDLAGTTTLGSGTNDLIAIGGSLDLSGTSTIQLNPMAGSFAVGAYTLVSNSTALVTGSAANLAASAPRGVSATFDTTTTPGSLLVTVSGTPTPASLVWNGVPGAYWDAQISQNWLNGASQDYFYFLDNVIFNDVGGGTVALPAGVSPSSTTFGNSATNYVLNNPGAIGGPGSLTVNGGGTVTLNTANNYTGDTAVRNGSALILGVLAAAPHIAVYNGVGLGNLLLDAGNVFLSDNNNDTYRANFNNLVVGTGGSSVAMRNRASSSSYIYQFNTVSRTDPGGTVDFNNIQSKASSPQVGLLITNTTTVNGILGGFATIYENDWVVPVATGGGSFAYAGYQTNNTTPSAWGAASNVVVTATPSAALNDTAINSLKLPSSATLTINSGQTLRLSSGGLLVPGNAGGAATVTGGTLMGATNADLIVHENSQANALTIGSVIADNTGTTALTKSGQGKLILTGANTFTGPTYINGRTLAAGNNNTPGLFPAGTLQIGNGGVTGSIDTSAGVTNNANLAFNRSDAITFALPISGVGGLNVAAGNVTLTANNSFSGATTITAGTLQVGSGGTSGTLGVSPTVANSGTLAFNRSDDVTYAGIVSGTGSLAKQGAGRLTLGGANTYQGNTTVNVGTLALGAAGSISNSAAIVVAAGATVDVSAVSGFALNDGLIHQTLQGDGTVVGGVTAVAGSRVAPGSGVGTLSFNNDLTFNGATLNFDISNTARDLVVVGGNLSLNAGAIQLTVTGTLANGTYRLIQYAGALGGSVGNMTVSGFSQPGQIAELSSATPGEIDLVVSTFVAANLVWQGNGGNNLWDVGITADWTNASGVASVFRQNDNVTFNDTSANLLVNLAGVLTPGVATVDAAANYAWQGTGQIGGGTIIKNNTGSLTVLTTNSSTGPVTINGGTIQLGDGVAAGVLGSGAVVNSGALVFNEPGDTAIANSISGAGSVTQQGIGVVRLTADNTFSGPLNITAGSVVVGAGGSTGSLGTGPVTNDATLVIDRSGALTINSAIAGTGALIVEGPGTVTLGGANTYFNNTYISNGVVKLGASQVIPDGGSTTGWLILDAGTSTAGTLDLNGFNETVNALAGLAGAAVGQVVNNGGSGTNTLTVSGAVNTTFAGRIRDNTGTGGKVALVKDGTGTLTLQPPVSPGSSYSGGTSISNGVVSGGTSQTANGSMCGTGPVTFYGGTLTMAGFTGSTTPDYGVLANPLIVPANLTGTVNGTCRGGLNSTLTGSGTFNYVARYVRGDVNGDWSAFTGVINVTSQSGSSDDFRINNTAGWPNAKMSLGTGVNMYGRVANAIIPIGELSGTGSLVTAAGGSGGQATVWRVGVLNTSTNFSGGVFETVGILKDGSGTWTLDGAVQNNYSGVTAVTNGTLVLATNTVVSSNSVAYELRSPSAVINVASLSSGTLYVDVGQALRGIGTVQGSVNVSGTLAPGYPIGTLTVSGTATLSGTNLMELNRTNSPATNDMLAAAAIIGGGILRVSNVGPDLQTGDSYKLFSGAVSGFSAIDLPATNATGSLIYTWDNRLATDGSIVLSSAVPSVNTTPTNIMTGFDGANLTLSWPSDHIGWRLQTNSVDIGGANWFDVPGSAVTNRFIIPVDPAQGKVFYRMVYP